MDFTRTLLHRAADHLNEDGVLVLEVGMSWPLLEEAYPQVLFDWAELQRGGGGVLAISRDELLAWRDSGVRLRLAVWRGRMRASVVRFDARQDRQGGFCRRCPDSAGAGCRRLPLA